MKPALLYFKTRRQFLLLLYVLIYAPWFAWLEKTINENTFYHLIHSPIDDLIPFCEYFVLAYYVWFGYVIAVIIAVALFDGPTCWKHGVFLIVGMTIALLICTFYPNGVDLRPDSFARSNICTDLCRRMYATDTPTNVLPSLHVYNAIGTHIALSRCRMAKNMRKLKTASFILMVLIILSTMFIKQHSFIDVLASMILAAVMFPISYHLVPRIIRSSRIAPFFIEPHPYLLRDYFKEKKAK